MKRILFLTLLFLSALAHAQAGFQATSGGFAGGSLSNHQDCSTTPCTVVDTRISNSTASGFTSPAQVTFVHFNGKDFNASPDNGVIEFGQFQFGTGSFISGSLSSTALFDVDQSYVTIGTNGSCGQFKADGTCKPGGFLPNTATMFVGVFVGRISWSTNLDNSHVIEGTVRGFVNGGTTQVFLNLVCNTAADPNPFASNGWLPITTVTIAPF